VPNIFIKLAALITEAKNPSHELGIDMCNVHATRMIFPFQTSASEGVKYKKRLIGPEG
jgi:hypothetical protein